MIWIALLAFFIGIAALIARGKAKSVLPEVGFGSTVLGIGGIVIAIVAGIGSALTVVPAGHVGVPVVFGKVSDRALPEGLQVKNPFAIVQKLSVRTETYTMSIAQSEGQVRGDDSIRALSKDGLALPMDITVAYRLVSGDAPWVFRNFGLNFAGSILRAVARTAIRDATSKYTFQECYSTKREELAAEMERLLVKRIKDLVTRRDETEEKSIIGLAVDQVMLRNVEPPVKVKQAIEAKLAAEQDAQRMEFILLKETKEAERKVIEAQGIRDFQKIVNEGLTPSYLTWKGIEATGELAKSPNSKVVVIGSGDNGLPIILGGQ